MATIDLTERDMIKSGFRSNFLLLEKLIDQYWHSLVDLALDMDSELLQLRQVHFLGDMIVLFFHFQTFEGVDPIPEILIMQVLIDKRLILVIFRVGLRIFILQPIAEGGMDVVLIIVFLLFWGTIMIDGLVDTQRRKSIMRSICRSRNRKLSITDLPLVSLPFSQQHQIYYV